MVWGLVFGAAAAADAPTDVVVRRTVDASPATIHAALDDWRDWQAILPGDCASDWAIQEPAAGVGAQAEATYRFGPLRRRATGVIRRDEAGFVFETEHLGKRGWFTQVTYAEAGDSRTEVTLKTPLGEPQWPFRLVFAHRVRPAWEGCYQRALAALEARVGG